MPVQCTLYDANRRTHVSRRPGMLSLWTLVLTLVLFYAPQNSWAQNKDVLRLPPGDTLRAELDDEEKKAAVEGPVPITIHYRFYSARSTSWERQKKHWENAMAWWKDRINKACQGSLSIKEIKRLKDDTKSDRMNRTFDELRHQFPKTSPKYALKGNWPRSPHAIMYFATSRENIGGMGSPQAWLVGLDELVRRITKGQETAPSTFHIALFRLVKDDPSEGKSGTVPGVMTPGTNVLAADANVLSQGHIAMKHEIGHLFGLPDHSGGIMDKDYSKTPGGGGWYGDSDFWRQDWCRTISTHLSKKP